MKKNNKLLIIISIFIISIFIVVILITNIENGKKGINVLHRTNNNISTDINFDVSDMSIENLGKKLEQGNSMNISVEEMFTYGTENGELLGFFKEEGYNILYLYTCELKSKLMYECPKEGFTEFTNQFTLTGTIDLIKGKNSYFSKGNMKFQLLETSSSVNFLRK